MPQKTPDTPLPRLRFIGSCPKCEKRPAAIHPSPPAHMAARTSAAPLTRRAQAHCARSSSRELADARSRRAKDMQQQRPRASAASRHLHLSANANSTVLLLGFRRSYLPSSTLHHRITHFANVLADMPMSCVVHRLSCAISAFLFFLEKTVDTLPSHRCATSTSM
jgi:hypothetical protein